MARFNIILKDDADSFMIGFESPPPFAAEMGSVVEVLPHVYGGDYTVTPIVDEDIVLPTKSKTMAEDLTVRKIPIYEMDNDRGGTTVYIAMEVEG